MDTYELPSPNPFGGNLDNWHGSFMNDEDMSTDLVEDDIQEVLWSYEAEDAWQGDCAALVKMKDGRYITWESWWGPTGNGFCYDAYGGDTDVHITTSLRKALDLGLSNENSNREKASSALRKRGLL